MNSQRSHRPGPVCRVVRQWESWRGAEAGHTRITARHLETCEACREFFAEDAAFEDMLRSSARAERNAAVMLPAAGFEQRILRAVRENAGQPERPARRMPVFAIAFSLAGAAAAVALAAIVALRMGPTEPAGPSLTEARTGVRVVGDANGEATAEVATSAWRSALELAGKNPLEQEIVSVSEDAKSVIDFLALNFLPTDAGSGKKVEDRG